MQELMNKRKSVGPKTPLKSRADTILAEDRHEPPDEDEADGDDGADDVDRHGKGQSTSLHFEAILLKDINVNQPGIPLVPSSMNSYTYFPRGRLTLEKW